MSKKLEIRCMECGGIFTDYISNNRKFCSRKCYTNNAEQRRISAEKCSKKLQEFYKGGGKPWNKGVPMRSESKEKLRKKQKERMSNPKNRELCARYGEEAAGWKGGKSFEKYPQDWTDTLKEAIRERDNYVCQECGIHQEELGTFKVFSKIVEKKLDVHHLDYDKNNCDPKNLISLCKSCHSKTNYNREYWKKYFYKEE